MGPVSRQQGLFRQGFNALEATTEVFFTYFAQELDSLIPRNPISSKILELWPNCSDLFYRGLNFLQKISDIIFRRTNSLGVTALKSRTTDFQPLGIGSLLGARYLLKYQS